MPFLPDPLPDLASPADRNGRGVSSIALAHDTTVVVVDESGRIAGPLTRENLVNLLVLARAGRSTPDSDRRLA